MEVFIERKARTGRKIMQRRPRGSSEVEKGSHAIHSTRPTSKSLWVEEIAIPFGNFEELPKQVGLN